MTLLCQDEREGYGEGLLDLGVAYMMLKAEMESFHLVREMVFVGERSGTRAIRGQRSLQLAQVLGQAQDIAPPSLCRVYVAEVAPKKAAAANVETVFSGAGKFMEEAKSTGPTLLQRMTRLHYNWKYEFLRPTIESVVARYKLKFQARSSALDSAPNP